MLVSSQIFKGFLTTAAILVVFFIVSKYAFQNERTDALTTEDFVPSPPLEVIPVEPEPELEEEKDEVCSVCYEHFNIDSESHLTHCGHFYHEGCILRWINRVPPIGFTRNPSTCPLCNDNVDVKDKVDFYPYFERIRTDDTPKMLIIFLKYLIVKSLYPEHYEMLMNEIKRKNPDWTANDKITGGMSWIKFAAMHKNYTAIKCFLKFGADLNELNAQSLSDLIRFAINNEDTDVATKLFNELDVKLLSVLFLAARSGATGILKLLVEKGVDLSEKEESTGLNALQLAVLEGNAETVKYLLELGRFDLNVLTERNENLVHFAVWSKNEEVFDLVLEQESLIDLAVKPDVNGESPIETAFEDEDTTLYEKIINKFIQTHPNLNINDSFLNGKTLLTAALDCENIRLSAVEYLAGLGADLSQINNDQSEYVINLAVKIGQLELVKLLLDNGLKTENKFGIACFRACDAGRHDILELLVENGADVNKQKGKNNLNLVQTSIVEKDTEILKILLEYGKVDYNVKTESGQNLLHLAFKSSNEEIIETLLNHESPNYNLLKLITQSDNEGETPFGISISYHKYNFYELFIDKIMQKHPDREVFESLQDGKSLLTIAAEKQNYFAMEYLINLGANINHLNGSQFDELINGELRKDRVAYAKSLIEKRNFEEAKCDFIKSLHYAVHIGMLDIVNLLIESGADVKNNSEAVQLATLKGKAEIFKILFETGDVDLSAKDRNGENLLYSIVSSKNIKILNFLLENAPHDCNFFDMAKDLNHSGQSAFTLALSDTETEIYKLLIQLIRRNLDNRSIDEPENRGRTFLMHAVIHRNFEAAEYLLELGADVKLLEDEHIHSWITHAIKQCRPLLAVSLIESVTELKEDYAYDLCLAVCQDMTDVVKSLVEKGANLNKKIKTGPDQMLNAIERAFIAENQEILKILLETGRANLAVSDRNIIKRALGCRNAEIPKLLLDYLHSNHKFTSEYELTGNRIAIIEAALQDTESKSYEMIINKILEISPDWFSDLHSAYKVDLLSKAVEFDNFDAVKFLVGLGAQLCFFYNDPRIETLKTSAIGKYIFEQDAVVYEYPVDYHLIEKK